MFIHVVMMSFKAAADAAFHARVQAYAQRVQAECEGLVHYLYGDNEASRADGLTHAVVSSFVDAAAHERYQLSPAHLEMKAYMADYIERMAVFDSGQWG